jgi:hypothetical protein
MSTVTVQLPPDTERKLRDRAGQLGQTLETFLQQLADTAAGNGTLSAPFHREPNGNPPIVDNSDEFSKFISRPRVTVDELEHLLDEFSAGSTGKVLPSDFSRADIYDDHD